MEAYPHMEKKDTVDLLSILSDMIKAEYVSDGVYVKEKL